VYFGKTVGDLTLIEGAFLAGMVRSPSGDDPIRKPYESRQRFGQVMGRLVDVGLVSKLEGDRLAEEWVLPEITRSAPGINTTPTYYSSALTEYLLQRSNLLGDTEQERANLLYRGGLRIYTTLDPVLQAQAEEARNELPGTFGRFDAAIVSLDTNTGAVRAMVGGQFYDPIDRSVNMALVPRQTGSSIKLFILAAALQAGAQPNDVLDGARPCTLPNPDNPSDPFTINEGASGFVGTLERHTASSINCAYSRLAQIVGLNRVVNLTYDMAASAYLYKGQPASERDPILPYASYATGANEMSPLDMAAGMQTIANGGLHRQPYYVDRIVRADGTDLYLHFDIGTQVLDRGVALSTVKTMKTVISGGTASRALGGNSPDGPLAFPASGKTGTQEDNTNSWFVGATPHLTTSVWVGDPNGYTPMVDVPEFVADSPSVRKVQGGTYPARIWRRLMEPAHATRTVLDWEVPPNNPRRAMRLYLPGNECLATVVSGVVPPPPGSPTTTAPPTLPPETNPDGSPIETAPTTVPQLVVREIDSGTTIPRDNLDPRAPLPMTDLTGIYVFNCERPPAGVIVNRRRN
jgi:penicillin-binding protein 1A